MYIYMYLYILPDGNTFICYLLYHSVLLFVYFIYFLCFLIVVFFLLLV